MPTLQDATDGRKVYSSDEAVCFLLLASCVVDVSTSPTAGGPATVHLRWTRFASKFLCLTNVFRADIYTYIQLENNVSQPLALRHDVVRASHEHELNAQPNRWNLMMKSDRFDDTGHTPAVKKRTSSKMDPRQTAARRSRMDSTSKSVRWR